MYVERVRKKERVIVVSGFRLACMEIRHEKQQRDKRAQHNILISAAVAVGELSTALCQAPSS